MHRLYALAVCSRFNSGQDGWYTRTLNALTSPALGFREDELRQTVGVDLDVPTMMQLYWLRCSVILCLRPCCLNRALRVVRREVELKTVSTTSVITHQRPARQRTRISSRRRNNSVSLDRAYQLAPSSCFKI